MTAAKKQQLVWLLCLLCVFVATTARAQNLTKQEKRGKLIYVKGESEAGAITATLGVSDLEVPASLSSCANCHGRRGEGTREGGLQPPPIDWETLTNPFTSPLTRRERVAYNEATVARAISSSLDSTGRRLLPAMPRYSLTREQMDDLVAYLKQVGKDSDNEIGVTDNAVKIGAVLPLSGPLAKLGADIKSVLVASFEETNRHGGIYGRHFELVVEDSGGSSQQTLTATQRLIDQGVFTLVASFEPGDSSAVNELIKREEIPLVGPLTLAPRLEVLPNPYIFYLIPTFADQARTLVDFVKVSAQGKPARLGVVYSRNHLNRDALSGLRVQSRLYSMEIASEQEYETGKLNAREAVERLAQAHVTDVFFFGAATDFKALADEVERVQLKVHLFSSVVMLGRGAFDLSASLSSQTFLSYPSALPNETDFAEFLELTRAARIELSNPAFQSMAFAAAKIFIEAAKQSGKQLDRAIFISSLERLRDFKTGVVPPVTFGPNRRVGSAGSYIVGIDLAKQQYVPLTERLTPKDKP